MLALLFVLLYLCNYRCCFRQVHRRRGDNLLREASFIYSMLTLFLDVMFIASGDN